ncbi:MAG: hypothetical protein OEY86_07470 [Nitrospira sp.]|nr:hypothetical protein [Nitrospira sp.]
MRVTILLKWEPVYGQDLAGYKVRWGLMDKKPSRVVIVKRGTTSMMLVMSVRRKTVYGVTVASYDVAGNESTQTMLTSVYVD